MRHFPIFLDLTDRRVLFSGAGNIAAPKIRLVLKTGARIEVYGNNPVDQVRDWASRGQLTLVENPLQDADLGNAALLYCANGVRREDRRVAELAAARRVLVNIVDNLEDSQFITPAIVDRDPVTVAIGTEGAAPVLARKIKSDLESRLPAATGTLARVARSFRNRAAMIGSPRRRRQFWERFFDRDGPRAWSEGGLAAAESRLRGLLVETLVSIPETGSVQIVDVGAGDPDFLTVRAKRLIETADRVFHDSAVAPAILELARREADIVCCRAGESRESGLAAHAARGELVVWLGSAGTCSSNLMESLWRSLAGRGINCEFHHAHGGAATPVMAAVR